MNISAYITAGGKSKRFKQDKSLFLLEGKPLIQHVVDIIRPIFDDIIIISNDTEKFNFLGLETIEDIIHGIGPIGGLHAALTHSKDEKIFIFPCDMPYLNSEFINYMISLPEEYDVVIPSVGGYYEPLHAIYSKTCLPFINESIENKEYQIYKFFDNVNVRKVADDEIEYYDDPLSIFRNINYLEDIS